MKSIIISVIVCFSFSLAAQDGRTLLQVKNTSRGIFIMCGDRTLLSQPVDLYRKASGESTYRKIASLAPPESAAGLEKRIGEAQQMFRAGSSPKAEGVADTWKAWQAGSDTLKAFIAVVPQLAYVFNKAYLDNDVKLKTAYQYRLVHNGKILMTSEAVVYTAMFRFPDLTGLSDTMHARSIVFTLPYSDDYHLYVDITTKRKLFTETQSAFAPVDMSLGIDKSRRMASATLSDNTLRDISQYDYQLRQRNIFGEMDTAIYPVTASNVPKQLYIRVTSLKAVSQQDNHTLRLRWTLSDPERVQSMTLYKSDTHNGKFIAVQHLNRTDTATSDVIDIANELYFYYLEVTDVMGQKSRSAQIHAVYQSDYAPTPVMDLSAMTANKAVVLRWRASDQYTRGFYVYRKTGSDGEFRQVSTFVPVRDGRGTFIDSTARNAGTAVYFTVKAESDTYRKSTFSDTVSVYLPMEKNAMKPPLDVNTVFRKGYVQITWENLSAQWPIVAGYHVYRKKSGEQTFTKLTTHSLLLDNRMIDSTLLVATNYQYAVASVDGDGNESLKSLPVTMDLSHKFVVLPETLGVELTSGAIVIKWTNIDVLRIKNIQMYRAEGDADFKRLTMVANDSREFMDRTVKRGIIYSYRLTTISSDGVESEPTHALVVSN